MGCARSGCGRRNLDCEIFRAKLFVFKNFFCVTVENDGSGVEDDSTISKFQRRDGVLLDDDRCDALIANNF